MYRPVFCLHFCKPISGRDTPSPHLPRTKAVPSSLHACIRVASSLHDNRAVYVVRMRVSRIIKQWNPERLSLPWSEQTAKEERRRSEQSANILRFLRAKRCRKCLKRTGCCFTFEKIHESGTRKTHEVNCNMQHAAVISIFNSNKKSCASSVWNEYAAGVRALF